MYTVIKEVFADTCSVLLQCTFTDNLVLLDCKDLEDSFLQEKSEGILFRSLICGLCNGRVNQSSDGVVVFECERFAFNHSFH